MTIHVNLAKLRGFDFVIHITWKKKKKIFTLSLKRITRLQAHKKVSFLLYEIQKLDIIWLRYIIKNVDFLASRPSLYPFLLFSVWFMTSSLVFTLIYDLFPDNLELFKVLNCQVMTFILLKYEMNTVKKGFWISLKNANFEKHIFTISK